MIKKVLLASAFAVMSLTAQADGCWIRITEGEDYQTDQKFSVQNPIMINLDQVQSVIQRGSWIGFRGDYVTRVVFANKERAQKVSAAIQEVVTKCATKMYTING